MISVQLLAIAYAIIGALLLYLLVATRRTVSFKIFMVVLLSGLYVSTYLSLKELQGWPVTEDLPKRFRLHWAIITEPDKAQKAVGRIYLWIQPTAPSGKLVDKPRAYYLPYDAAMAEKVQNALRQIDEGQAVEGQLSRAQLASDTQANGTEIKLEPDLDPFNSAFQPPEAGLQFRALPRTSLPPKGS
jgi:hypothetical protein